MRRTGHLIGRRQRGALAAALVVLALTTACLGGAASTTRDAPYPTGSSYAEKTERQLVDLMNNERATNGLGPLAWNGQLGWLAMDWSQTMAKTGSFGHRDLGSAITNLVSGFSRLGENILVGSCGMSAGDMHRAWMNSPGHRANILASGYNTAAVGVLCGSDGRVWATTNFGLI